MTQDLASRLRERITIEAAELTAGDGGSFTVTWNEIATVWAEVQPVTTVRGEMERDEQVQSAQRYRMIIRYRSDLSAEMRIQYAGKIFNIRQVAAEDARHETLMILAEQAAG